MLMGLTCFFPPRLEMSITKNCVTDLVALEVGGGHSPIPMPLLHLPNLDL